MPGKAGLRLAQTIYGEKNLMVAFVKKSMLSAARTRAFARFVAVLGGCGDRRRNLLRVLTYHRVDEPDRRPDLYPGTMSATPADFARQMEHLASRYQVVGMEEVLDAVRGRCELPPRSVLITFDDAYRDFSEQAWPVLQGLGLPATLFVPTSYPGQPSRSFWWDRLHHAVCCTAGGEHLTTPCGTLRIDSAEHRQTAMRRLLGYAKSLPHRELEQFVEDVSRQQSAAPPEGCVLSWQRLRQLRAEGLTVAAHTRTHPLLNRTSLDEARDEAVASRDDLVREIGPTPPVFAYPGGAYTNEVAAMLRREGFELALTTCRGVNHMGQADPMRLRRINVGRRTPLPLWRAQLLPMARWLNFCWTP